MHPFFREYTFTNKVVMQEVCSSALSQMEVFIHDCVFNEGEQPFPARMLFVMRGDISYSSGHLAWRTILGEGDWACEVVFWMDGWLHVGSLVAASQAILVSLDVEAFQKIIVHYVQSAKYPRLYAHEFYKQFFLLHLQRRESSGGEILDLAIGQGDAAGSGVDAERIVTSVFPQKRRLLRQRNTALHNSQRQSDNLFQNAFRW